MNINTKTTGKHGVFTVLRAVLAPDTVSGISTKEQFMANNNNQNQRDQEQQRNQEQRNQQQNRNQDEQRNRDQQRQEQRR